VDKRKTSSKTIIFSTIIMALIMLFPNSSNAQRNASDTVISTPWISVSYGGNWTTGDLKERYGYLNHIGFFAGYKTNKNWIYGLEGNFIFGNQINVQGLFDNLVDSKGNITDVNGDVAIVQVVSRGMNINAAIGKVFPILSTNKNSGIYAKAGIGFLAHKMRIETRDHVVPQIELDYRKGYDRLASGINIHQFLGYAFMANRGAFNFYGGFYAQQGFTKNRRDVFFDQPNIPVSKDLRMDMQYGFKIAWLIPIYKRMPKSFYYD